ncbi:hypothetical protein Cs7R123_07080 [Catellatospora sp. TT07R-123]|uniref:HEAT repeat domain-containing protein n=1 Tax=Catellatospora sp. TT07R-123 TaxID=2733863 RepID=UPI001B2DC49B|nr:HEAT repeat domain-containing protein [Catellatospora sp. TT07R-123]GHJ43366.1 hypothetical protein Cs7R123_07080 [Catellatospora sp. TT07R-123]
MVREWASLRSNDPEVRVEALSALYYRAMDGDGASRQALADIAADHRAFPVDVYSRALNWTFLFPPGDLTGPLLEALADEEYGCAPYVAMACGRLRVRAAVPLILALLDDPYQFYRGMACTALGEIGDPAAAAALAHMLDDPSEHVRAEAANALAEIGGQEAVGHLWARLAAHPAPSQAGHLASAIANARPGSFDRLVATAADDDPELRHWAARALGATGDDRAEPLLERLAEDTGTVCTGGRVSTAARRGLKTLRRLQARRAVGDTS